MCSITQPDQASYQSFRTPRSQGERAWGVKPLSNTNTRRSCWRADLCCDLQDHSHSSGLQRQCKKILIFDLGKDAFPMQWDEPEIHTSTSLYSKLSKNEFRLTYLYQTLEQKTNESMHKRAQLRNPCISVLITGKIKN